MLSIKTETARWMRSAARRPSLPLAFLLAGLLTIGLRSEAQDPHVEKLIRQGWKKLESPPSACSAFSEPGYYEANSADEEREQSFYQSLGGQWLVGPGFSEEDSIASLSECQALAEIHEIKELP